VSYTLSKTHKEHFFNRMILLLFLLLVSVRAYDTGDRVSTSIQTLHNGWKTAIAELPLSQMPHFGRHGDSIINTPLPQPDPSRGSKISPSEDVKVQLTFGNSLIIPWITVFDSKNQRNLEALTVNFFTDRYNIVRVTVDKVYIANSARLDPNHPSVTAFTVKYVWQGVEDQDTPHGLFVMFLFAAVLAIFITLVLNSSSSQMGVDDEATKRKVAKRR
jgi:hypothetical protein